MQCLHVIIFTICVGSRKPGCLLPFTVYFVNDLLYFAMCSPFIYSMFILLALCSAAMQHIVLFVVPFDIIVRFHYGIF